MNLNVFAPDETAWAAGLLHDGMDAVERALPAPPVPRTPEDWQRMRVGLLKRVRAMLGIPPAETCDLNARVLGVTRRKEYAVERIVIESRPDCPVPMTLYRPLRIDRPIPGVLCPQGHAAAGKAHDAYQSYFIGLARKGYCALAYDMVGFNERDGMGHRWVHAPFLHGGSAIGQIVWDGMKALDYLCARPDVDETRIGCTGNSGGGKQTLFLSALDERIAVSAPAGHNATYAYTARKERCICACNTLPGLLSFAEMETLFSLIAPRPCLMVMGSYDHLFPRDSTRRVYRRAKRVYQMMGVPDLLELALEDCGHHFDRPKREAMYLWFNRFLKGVHDPSQAEEKPARSTAAGSASVTCFPDGELPSGSASAHELAARDAAPVLAKARARLTSEDGRKAARADLAKILWPAGRKKPQLRSERRETRKTRWGHAETFLVWADTNTPLPCVLLPGNPSEVTLVVDGEGKSSPKAKSALESLVGEGRSAAAVDLRGWGELRARNLSEDGAEDEIFAGQRGLFYDAPLMGLRVGDLLAARDWLAQRYAKVRLHGIGLGGLLSALAAAVTGNFAEVVLAEIPESFLGSLPKANERSIYPVSFYIPRILEAGDVADIVALAQAPTVIESVAGASGRKLGGKRLDSWREEATRFENA